MIIISFRFFMWAREKSHQVSVYFIIKIIVSIKSLKSCQDVMVIITVILNTVWKYCNINKPFKNAFTNEVENPAICRSFLPEQPSMHFSNIMLKLLTDTERVPLFSTVWEKGEGGFPGQVLLSERQAARSRLITNTRGREESLKFYRQGSTGRPVCSM